MPKESLLWRDDVSRLKSFGEIDRIEDALKCGVSDCIYNLRWKDEPSRAGWMELKRLLYWPVRASTVIRLPHFSLDQVNFLERWGRSGMGAFLLAQVADEFFLFPWAVARAIHEGVGRNRFTALAAVHGVGAFPAGRILRCLTETSPVKVSASASGSTVAAYAGPRPRRPRGST